MIATVNVVFGFQLYRAQRVKWRQRQAHTEANTDLSTPSAQESTVHRCDKCGHEPTEVQEVTGLRYPDLDGDNNGINYNNLQTREDSTGFGSPYDHGDAVGAPYTDNGFREHGGRVQRS